MKLKIPKKLRVTIYIIFSIFLLLFLLGLGPTYKKNELEYGITFSKKQSENLGLDWKELYINILDDLKVKKIRLPVYWDLVEPQKNNFIWDDIDWQINMATEKNIDLIITIGARVPRWPECHFPEWVKNLNNNERQTETLSYIEASINRYKNIKQIKIWQIENEPFLPYFGECPKLDKNFLDKEIALAKSLDNRPILVTDSGELSFWIEAAKRGDIFGTTMYRDTYSSKFKSYIHYPILPSFFKFKKNITSIFASPKKWIVIELQAEPWGSKPYQYISASERSKTMDLEKFKDMIEFSSKTGFKEFYLWGVEWWYWEKIKQNNPYIWEEAKKLFIKN